MFHATALAALQHVIPAQAGIQTCPQRTAGGVLTSADLRHAHRARCGAAWVPAFAGTTQGVKLMPKVV